MFMLVGCFHTRYVNLHPRLAIPPHSPTQIDRGPSNDGWQHFFLFGWVPSEKLIDAQAICGGTEHIDRIETEMTFVQGLVGLLARGSYVNIYSPYTGRVVCDHSSPRR
jgi:hypothetical protein